jgi:hypothetical protein
MKILACATVSFRIGYTQQTQKAETMGRRSKRTK